MKTTLFAALTAFCVSGCLGPLTTTAPEAEAEPVVSYVDSVDSCQGDSDCGPGYVCSTWNNCGDRSLTPGALPTDLVAGTNARGLQSSLRARDERRGRGCARIKEACASEEGSDDQGTRGQFGPDPADLCSSMTKAYKQWRKAPSDMLAGPMVNSKAPATMDISGAWCNLYKKPGAPTYMCRWLQMTESDANSGTKLLLSEMRSCKAFKGLRGPRKKALPFKMGTDWSFRSKSRRDKHRVIISRVNGGAGSADWSYQLVLLKGWGPLSHEAKLT